MSDPKYLKTFLPVFSMPATISLVFNANFTKTVIMNLSNFNFKSSELE